jgi:hypothetical protein
METTLTAAQRTMLLAMASADAMARAYIVKRRANTAAALVGRGLLVPAVSDDGFRTWNITPKGQDAIH